MAIPSKTSSAVHLGKAGKPTRQCLALNANGLREMSL
jgi:hypothetical protein